MSTELNNAQQNSMELPMADDMRVAIVTAEWNSEITEALTQGALDTLKKAGMDPEHDINVFHVPGTVELTYAASQLIDTSLFDAVIVLGCVIRGETPHFDYVCQSVTQGVTELNANYDIPVIFGVLTVENHAQAQDRAGGRLGNKGSECAVAAIKMVQFARATKEL